MFLFDGAVLDPSTIDRIRLPSDELSEFRFVDPGEAGELLTAHTHRRLAATIAARARRIGLSRTRPTVRAAVGVVGRGSVSRLF